LPALGSFRSIWRTSPTSASALARSLRWPATNYKPRPKPRAVPIRKKEGGAHFHHTLPTQLLNHVQAAPQQGYQPWRLWTRDESRCGLLPILRRRLTARVVHPLVPAAYRFEGLTLYGAVAPLTGESFFLELPPLNTPGFQLFLDHSAATDSPSSHLLRLDHGAPHNARSLRLPRNVGLLLFPPSAPELDPIARLWRDLKDRLARHRPATLEALSALLGSRLQQYTTAALRSLTGFSDLRIAAHQVLVQSHEETV
jgi:hypothetical protein